MNHPGRTRHRPAAWLAALLACAAPTAWAQSANCEAFKDRVAASIEAKGVQGYALEIVPSRAPRPAGARAVGTCDGGAYTVLYRRWGGAPDASSAPAEAAGDAASAPEAPATSEAATPAPRTRAERLKAERAKAASAAAAAAAASAPVAPAPATKAADAKPADAKPADAKAASKPADTKPASKTADVKAAAASAAPPAAPVAKAQAAPPQTVAATVAAAPVGAAPPPEPRPATSPVTDRASSSFDEAARPVVWGLVVVLVAAALVRVFRRWWHDRYYDEAGLPRGPRL